MGLRGREVYTSSQAGPDIIEVRRRSLGGRLAHSILPDVSIGLNNTEGTEVLRAKISVV